MNKKYFFCFDCRFVRGDMGAVCEAKYSCGVTKVLRTRHDQADQFCESFFDFVEHPNVLKHMLKHTHSDIEFPAPAQVNRSDW